MKRVINDYELSSCFTRHRSPVQLPEIGVRVKADHRQCCIVALLVNAEVTTDILANLLEILSTSVLVTQYLNFVQDAVQDNTIVIK